VVGKVALSDTGPLPSSGGARETSLLNVSNALLTAEVLHATTIGMGNNSQSEASVANVSLTAAGHTITADLLMSRAAAVCNSGNASASGSSEILGLSVDGQPITVSGQPNQTISVDGTTIVINEQKSGPGSITVNALHVSSTTVAPVDVVISSAHADISNCPTPPGQVNCSDPDEFVTGGGWITAPSGNKGTFAVAAGKRTGWGHLEYIDHGTGMKVKGTAVTGYAFVDSTTRRIDGTADVDGTSDTYTVYVADNAEPGHGADTFSILLHNSGYSAGGKLGGGNIQLHKPCE
jgi:hypothetical protein